MTESTTTGQLGLVIGRLKGMTEAVDGSLNYQPGYGDDPSESTLLNRTQTLEDLRSDLGEITPALSELPARLAELAEEIFELPAMLREMVGGRCGEAVDRAVEARRMVRELRELLGTDETTKEN